MPNPSVSIRLAVAGQAEIQSAFDAVGKKGQASFRVVGQEMDAASSASERLEAKSKAMAERILARNVALAAAARAAQEADRFQANLNFSTGIGVAPQRSARDSASAFEEGFAERERAAQVAAAQAAAAQAAARQQALAVNSRVNSIITPASSNDRGADVAAYGAELDRLRARYNPLFAAQQQYKATLVEIREAERVGAISERERAAAIDRTKESFVKQVESLKRSTDATKLNTAQVLEFGHVGRVAVEELLLGVSPVQILTMEGPRIAQAFGEGKGGVTGTLKALGGIMLGLLTPTKLLIGGVAGIGIAAAVAYSQWESAQERLRGSLMGTGRQAGATVQQLSAVARAGASAAGVSYSTGVDLASSYTRQGIGPQVTQQAIGYTPAYARATGQGEDLGAAGEQIAKALRDPAQGAVELNRSLGFLDGRVKTNIDNLVAQGRLDEARQTLSDALNATLKDTTEKTSRFGEAVNAAKDFFPRLGKVIAGAIDGPTDEERLRDLQREQQSYRDVKPLGGILGSVFGPGTHGAQADAMQPQIDALAAKIAADAATNAVKAAGDKRAADNRDLTLKGTDVIRELLPDIVKAQRATNDIALLQSIISNPEVLKSLGVTSGQASNALRNASVMQANADTDQRTRQDQDLAIKSLGDYTIAERAATEARREALRVLRETGDVTRANTAAENARNLIIEKANQEASDRADLAEQNAKLVGLNPYQRGLQEIENRYSGVGGYDKDEASARQLADSMKSARKDIEQGGDYFLDKVKEAAQALADKSANIGGPAMGTAGNLPYFASGPGKATPEMIADASKRTGIPSNIIAAIGTVENGGRLTGGTSMLGSNGKPSSAYGFGQLTNGAAADVAGAVPGFNKYDPNTAVFGSAEYLKILLQRNHGNLTSALNAYGGTGSYASKIASVAGNLPGSVPVANDNQRALTTAADNARGKRADVGAYVKDQADAPLIAANQTVKDQIALLEVQKATVGQTADQIKGAVAAQTLLNQYNDRGVPITANLTAGVKAYGDSVAAAAKEQTAFDNQQKKLVEGMDSVRDAASESLGTIVQGFKSGESAGKILQNVFDGLLNKALNFAENSLIDGLFGAKGTSQGGLMGGGFSSLISSLMGGIGGGGTALAGLGQGGIGHNAGGTTNWMGGLTEVGESGPEYVNVPKGSQIIPNSVAFAQNTPPPAKAGGPLVQVINNHPGAGIQQTEGRGPDGQRLVQIHVENALMQSAATNSRGFRAFASRATSRAGG